MSKTLDEMLEEQRILEARYVAQFGPIPSPAEMGRRLDAKAKARADLLVAFADDSIDEVGTTT